MCVPQSFFILQCAFTLLARAEMSGHTGGTETRSLHRVLGNILEFDILRNYTAPWVRSPQHGTSLIIFNILQGAQPESWHVLVDPGMRYPGTLLVVVVSGRII